MPLFLLASVVLVKQIIEVRPQWSIACIHQQRFILGCLANSLT
jgi:hypothetical protein